MGRSGSEQGRSPERKWLNLKKVRWFGTYRKVPYLWPNLYSGRAQATAVAPEVANGKIAPEQRHCPLRP
jgi:hypothetical protein